MDLSDELKNILGRYSGAGGGTAAAPEDTHKDFDQVAKAAPKDILAEGIAHALKSNQTPPFPQMIATVFTHADSNQKAGLMSRLLGAAGPGALGSLPGISKLISGGGKIAPEQADQAQPQHVQQLAAQAERNNPSIVDELSGFLSEHPKLVKSLGGSALAMAMQHIAGRL